MTTTVLGVNELIARFASYAAGAAVASEAATSRLAEEVADGARRLVPVDTGTLRDSIEAESDRVYTDVEYAGFVEYGTSVSDAQPYMRPAADTADAEPALDAAAAILGRL